MEIGRIVKIVVALGIVAGIAAIINYFALPAQTIHSGGAWFFWAIVLLIAALISLAFYSHSDYEDQMLAGISAVSIGGLALMILVGFICSFPSGKLVNSEKYQRLVEVANDTEFESDFEDISEDKDVAIAIIDFETAQLLGNRTIGNIDHASWYEVDDEFNLIKYQGNYYRISAVNYGDYFKYRKAKSNGMPGYVLVDAITGEATFHEVDGGFFYSPSGYFSRDLTRHLRNQYSGKQFGESFFEIDEEGYPYWITSVKTSTIGVWGGKQVASILITDAVTGKTEEYDVQDVPEWVDHCFDLNYLMTVVDYHYAFVDGYWNAVFSKTGVYKTSYEYRSSGKSDGEEKFTGYNSVIGKDGEIYFYAGLTPANGTESNTGFIMINTRTGNIKQYNYQSANAAEESSAQTAAESLVQNFGYKATMPIIVNVDGNATYLMTLKDKAGLVQRYSFCNVENYSIVVEAESLEDALNKYLGKLGKDELTQETETVSDESGEDIKTTTSEETVTESEEPKEVKTKAGTIEELYSASIEGTTYFYYKLVDDDVYYRASIVVNEMQIIAKVGDEVTLEYTEGDIFGEVTKIEF